MAMRSGPARAGESRLSASRLLAMARKETLHLLRDPRSLGLAFVLRDLVQRRLGA